MPTLFRLVSALALVVALIYAAMLALVFFVQPKTVEMVVPVPITRLDQPPVETPAQDQAPVEQP